jgi:hypothetical protein
VSTALTDLFEACRFPVIDIDTFTAFDCPHCAALWKARTPDHFSTFFGLWLLQGLWLLRPGEKSVDHLVVAISTNAIEELALDIDFIREQVFLECLILVQT